MKPTRYLIVNGDDFGLSPGVNRGVIQAHEQGILTSASLLVRWPGAAEAARYARAHPGLSLGLHLDLGEWAYRNGRWERLYTVVSEKDGEAVAREAARQLDSFRALAGQDPSHLDSHQHVHREEPTRAVLLAMASRLGVPLRHYCPEVHYCGYFYGQTGKGEPYPEGISVDGLLATLRELPGGVTELACHPGTDLDLDSMYAQERARELTALCASCVRQALTREGIELCSFCTYPRG